MKRILWWLGLGGIMALSACADEEIVLPGAREDIRAPLDGETVATIAPRNVDDRSTPIDLPPVVSNADWTQRISSPSTRTIHPSLGAAPRLVWSVNIGAGDGRKNRITADPVVADGRIFTLDAEALVSATSTAGAQLWTRNLIPSTDGSSDATGGGLALGDGKLFVSSGFGRLTALDPASGEILWQQKLQATGSGNPTYFDGRVYLVAGDEIAWALDAGTGRIDWQLSATPDINNVIGGPAPAVNDTYAVFAFGSGEVQGALRKGGLRLWDAQLAGQRRGFARANVGDITGDPVVVGDRVYVGSHSGRLVALSLGSGDRIWTAEEGPLSPVWPVGDSVFLISDRNELMRLSADDGSRIWGTKLPFFVKDRPRRQKEVFAHYGPVMAGGRLVVASNDGQLRSFDPESGQQTGAVAIPGGATTNPVVAGGVLYVVSTKGQLHAFR